jgi:GxxExxY protein
MATEAQGLKDAPRELTEKVIGAAIAVHSAFGPGLLERVYEAAMLVELTALGLRAEAQVPIGVAYRGQDLGLGFRADLIVEDCLLVEMKSVEELNDIHTAQVITYLRLLGCKRGLLLNFDKKSLREGIRRVAI